MSYDVVLLAETALSEIDARQVHSLHEDVEEGPVSYHLLIPVEDAELRVEGAMGSLATGEMLASPALAVPPEEAAELQQEMRKNCDGDVNTSLDLLRKEGYEATGESVEDDPVTALTAKVKEVDAREVIVLTRPHVVAEFFHLDWTSRARRHLGVPVLHLIEHERFDEQSGEGEGASLI